MKDALDLPELKVPKWPFFVATGFMLGLSYFLFYYQAKWPLTGWEMIACMVCVTLGEVLWILPYLLEYRAIIKYGALVKLIETSSLREATDKIQNLEHCVAKISSASDQLSSVQEQADKTTNLAHDITERMAKEVREFTAFMQKANDGEKSTLRLELEKFRRAENEWLNTSVFTLDHIFALNRAASRSGQPNLVTQLKHFQDACRDAARRVGLVPVLAATGEAFDEKRHQLPEGQMATAGSTVLEMIATGYTFQGKLIRPTLVQLEEEAKPAAITDPKPSQLNFETKDTSI